MAYFAKEDFFELCGYRFSKWYKCDIFYSDQKEEFAKNNQEYPCFGLFYDSQYACSDQMFDYLLELSYARRKQGVFDES